MGYFRIDDPGAPLLHGDTATCAHCGNVVVVKASDPTKITAGGFCTNCSWHTCRKCAGFPCTPFLKKIEQAEARARFLVSV